MIIGQEIFGFVVIIGKLKTVIITNIQVPIADVVHEHVYIMLYDDVANVPFVFAPPRFVRCRPRLLLTLEIVGIRKLDAAVP